MWIVSSWMFPSLDHNLPFSHVTNCAPILPPLAISHFFPFTPLSFPVTCTLLPHLWPSLPCLALDSFFPPLPWPLSSALTFVPTYPGACLKLPPILPMWWSSWPDLPPATSFPCLAFSLPLLFQIHRYSRWVALFSPPATQWGHCWLTGTFTSQVSIPVQNFTEDWRTAGKVLSDPVLLWE